MTEIVQLDGSDSKQFVFSYKNIFYAIRLSIVEEVEETISIQNTPIFDPMLLDITIYKGLPLPILDPSKFLQQDASQNSKNLSIVILKENDFKIGILMDKFYKILHLPFEKPENEEVHFLTALSVIENKTLAILNDKEILRHYKALFKLQIALKNEEDTLTKKNFQKKETEKFIFFAIESLNFGVPIAEVLEGLEVTPLFKVEPYLRGLVNLRGKIIPCIDVSVFLDLQLKSLNENTKFVILQDYGLEIALCVDSVSKMKEIEKSLIQTIHKKV